MDDPEISAMATVGSALEDLPDEAKARVLAWAAARYGMTAPANVSSIDDRPSGADRAASKTLGDLIDRAQPSTRADRALLIGHWLHLRGEQDFPGQAINDELKNLGDAAPNITDLMTSLMGRRPAPVRQTRRTGTGRQARKRYALTEAGRAVVQALLTRQ